MDAEVPEKNILKAVDLKDKNIVVQDPDCHILPTMANINAVVPYKGQPREYFSEEELISLTESILVKGQKDPVSVVEVSGIPGVKYVIVDGEGRWRGCLRADVSQLKIHIDTDIKTVADLFTASLILNFHKKLHTHMEISNALQREVVTGRSVREIALGVGKSIAWVYQYLSLQNLLSELQDLMHPIVSDDKRLCFSNAITIASISQKHQKMVYNQLSVAKTFKEKQAITRNTIAGLSRINGRKRNPSDDVVIFTKFIKRLESEVNSALLIKDDTLQSLVNNRTEKELSEHLDCLKSTSINLKKIMDRLESQSKAKK